MPIELLEAPDPTWVYRVCCEHNAPMYVGMTRRLSARLREHQRTQPWWGDGDWFIDAEMFPNRGVGAYVESTAIARLNPIHNVDQRPLALIPMLHQVAGLPLPLAHRRYEVSVADNSRFVETKTVTREYRENGKSA